MKAAAIKKGHCEAFIYILSLQFLLKENMPGEFLAPDQVFLSDLLEMRILWKEERK